MKGKEYPYDRKTAGMLFFNDEGTENGCLIFGGMKGDDGKVQSCGHLSFDRHMGDQVAVLNAEEGQRRTGIEFSDEPDIPMNQVTDALQLPQDQSRAKLRELYSGKNEPQQRVYLGWKVDRSAALELKDEQGRDRIVMRVASDGVASLQFLDEQGKVIVQFPRRGR